MNNHTNLYDVTAIDDTNIRRTVYSRVDYNTAVYSKNEILHESKRHYRNPRIRRHKDD